MLALLPFERRLEAAKELSELILGNNPRLQREQRSEKRLSRALACHAQEARWCGGGEVKSVLETVQLIVTVHLLMCLLHEVRTKNHFPAPASPIRSSCVPPTRDALSQASSLRSRPLGPSTRARRLCPLSRRSCRLRNLRRRWHSRTRPSSSSVESWLKNAAAPHRRRLSASRSEQAAQHDNPNKAINNRNSNPSVGMPQVITC